MNRPNVETLALMDAARAAHGNCTDYRLARMLGVQTSNTSGWRRGRHMSDEYAAKCAELAGLDPVETVLKVASERESGKTAEILALALVRLTRHGATIVLGALLLGFGLHFPIAAAACAAMAPAQPVSPDIYYAKYVARLLLRILAGLQRPMVLA